MSSTKYKTILLVEDEIIIAMAQKIALEEYGYNVITVESGEKAIEFAAENTVEYENRQAALKNTGYKGIPVDKAEKAVKKVDHDDEIDIVLMDIDLGKGMDGTQAAELILNLRDLPVLFLSNHTEPEVVEKTEKITSYGYVVKNSNITVLDASIKMAFKLFYSNTALKKEIVIKEEKEAELIEINEELHRNKKALEESYRYSRNLLESCLDPLVTISKLGKITDVNVNTEQVTGVPRDTLIGSDFSDYFTDPGRAREGYLEVFEKSYVKDYPLSIKHLNGKITDVLYNASLYQNEDGSTEGVFAAARDITELKKAEEELQRQLAEKETLLKEVHHRIKNNISSIEGILSLQIGSAKNSEIKSAIQDTLTRVQSMRVLYDKLLIGKDYKEVSTKNYIESLVDAITAVFVEAGKATIKKQIVDFTLNTKIIIPLGIIINELLTNIFKHAFSGRDRGHISIILDKTENHVSLVIQDNGNGIDEKIDFNKSPGFGLTIVRMLTEQLKGNYTIENNKGTRSVFTFDM